MDSHIREKLLLWLAVDCTTAGEIPKLEALIEITKADMGDSLVKAFASGRTGWWNKKECSIPHLKKLRAKALNEDDHISVINYTAMISVRERMESLREQLKI